MVKNNNKKWQKKGQNKIMVVKARSNQVLQPGDLPVGLVTIPRSVHGIANSMRVTLMYQEAFLTGSTQGYLTIRGNDIYDPQATASGFSVSGNQQPQFSDAWRMFYNKYTVLQSSCRAQIINSVSNTIPTYWELSPEDALITTSNAPQASVARFAKYAPYPCGPSTPAKEFKLSMTTAKLNGIPAIRVLDDDAYVTGVNQTPNDPWYWQLRYSSVDFTTNSFCWGQVHYKFDVVFSDPVQDDDNDAYLHRIKSIAHDRQLRNEKQQKQFALFEEARKGFHSGVSAFSSSKDEVKDEDAIVVVGPKGLKEEYIRKLR